MSHLTGQAREHGVPGKHNAARALFLHAFEVRSVLSCEAPYELISSDNRISHGSDCPPIRAISRSIASLFTLRQAIDKYTVEQHKAPRTLQDLVAKAYVSSIPAD